MIASLPMYERDETAGVTSRYWTAIRNALSKRGIEAPEQLTPGGAGQEFWASKELLLSQTCGLPYRLGLHRSVRLIGTPDMGLEDCKPGYYRSAIVVNKYDDRQRLAEFSSATLAINSYDSQSGYAAFYESWQLTNETFPQIVLSGAHSQSARMVANGKADIAALDAATWRQLKRYEECADDLKVLNWTAVTPTLPYICAAHFDSEVMFDSVQEAIASLDDDEREILGVYDLVKIRKEDYLEVDIPPLSKTGG